MLLDGLDSVAWLRLTCTVGTAEHIPSLLRRLTSPSSKLRKAALWHLTDDLMHQGSVWPGAVAAIPFIIELLAAPEVGGKADLLYLLRSLYELWYDGDDSEATSTAEHVSEDEEDAELDDRLPRVADGSQPQRAAIRAGIPIYLALLENSDPAMRLASARLLALCRYVTFDSRPVLAAAYERERLGGCDLAVSICLFLELGRLRRGREQQLTFFTDALRERTTSEAERIAAALEVVKIAKAEAPQEATDLLVATLAHPSRRLDAAYDKAVGGWGLAGSISRTLSELSPARLQAAVPALTAALPRIGRLRQHAAANVLLAALFNPTEGAVFPSASLTPQQRAALAALFNAAPYWCDAPAPTLGKFGIPETRPALADYLGLPLPPEDALGAVERPRLHRPPPFTRKAYQAQVHRRFGYLRLRRDMGYRFEAGPRFDLYAPSVAYLFIFPKTPAAVLALEREVVVLRALEAMRREMEAPTDLPTKLSMIGWNPHWSSRDTRAAGRAFMGRFDATGEPLSREVLERVQGTPRWAQIAVRLAEFLCELHATPLNRIPIMLPASEGKQTWERVYAEIRSRLFDYIPQEVRQRIANEFEAFLSEPGNWTWDPVLVHGDFAPRNILCSTYSESYLYLKGIQGWEHVGLGDPATDLAGLLGPRGYGEEFVHHFADAYPNLDEQLPRARFYAWARPLRDALDAPQDKESEAAERILPYYLG